MAASKNTSTGIATKWGIIYMLFSIVLTYLFDYLKVGQESPVRYISLIPFILFLFLAQKEYRDVLGGYISFGKAFSTGFRYAVFAGLLVALFVFLYTKYLNPEVYAASVMQAEARMREMGKSEKEINAAMEFMQNYGHIMGPFFAAVFSAISGVIISLIGAAIFKKERSIYDDDTLPPADVVE